MRCYLLRLKALCRGKPDEIVPWLDEGPRWPLFCLLVVVVGTGVYGATIGLWRAPLQGFYTFLKFPLLILLTTLGNALLNGMLAQLLGARVTFRATSLSILMSFTLAALILGALSPITLFLLWNVPPLAEASTAVTTHSVVLLSHVGLIAFAGVVANVRLYQLLVHLAGGAAVARRVLTAWLAGNLFLGAQLSWMARPFIGSPGLPVEFFRADALDGSFFESVNRAAHHIADQPEGE